MRTLVLSLAALSILAVPVHAGGCLPTTSEALVDTGPHAPVRFYVAYDSCPACPFSLWVYEESNGIDGLQRQDEVVDDTCGGPAHGGIAGDTILF